MDLAMKALSEDTGAESRETQVRAAQIRQLYSQARPGMYGALIGAVGLTYMLWNEVSRVYLLVWLGVFLIVQAGRHELLAAFHGSKQSDGDALRFGRWFLLGSSATALLWGLSALFLFPVDSLFHQLILVVFLTAVAASSAVAHSPVSACAIASILLALLPLMGRFMYEGGQISPMLGILGLVFISVLIGISRSVHAVIAKSITLGFDNEELIRNLEKARNDLEQRVGQRARELVAANDQLREEIAKRSEAEKALRESEDRYRRLVELSPYGIGIAAEGRAVFVNKALVRLLAASDAAQIIGKNVLDFVHPDDRQQAAHNMVYVEELSEGAPKFEEKYLRLDGETITVEVTAIPFTYEGKPAIQAVFRDVTDQRKAQEALRQSEEKYRLIFEYSPLGVFHFDSAGTITACNDNFVRTIGSSREALIGLNIVTDIKDQKIIACAQKALAGGIAHYEDYYESVTAQKTTPVKCEFGPIVNQDGSVVGGIGIVEDITERKRADDELRASEEKYRNILETITDGYHEVDLKGKLTLVNDSMCEILGYSRNELLGVDYRLLMDEENAKKVFQAYNTVFRTGRPNPGFRYEVITKDGRRRSISISITLIRSADGKPSGFRGILQDITESSLLEERLRQAAKMEGIGQLAGGIAHDFNNLLTAMMGYTNILAQQLPKEGSQHEKLEQIARAADRAAALTQQLLAFSRKQVLNMRILDLNEVIRDFEKMLRRLIGEDIAIRLGLSNELGAVEADASQVDQILLNLAVNARDAMPAGGYLTIETANVTLDSEYTRSRPEVEPGEYVMIAVTDTGRGMTPETLSCIFDPFFTTKEKGVGTGLGLATVYGIVKQHNGHISVYSEPQRGTTFKIYLPRLERSPDQHRQEVGLPSKPCGTETILVVEDEKAVRDLTRDALTLLGYVALTASDPIEAIEIAERHQGPIHLLLTDVVLPRMDGRNLYTLLSGSRTEMKVLFMSGYTENFIVHHGVLDRDVHFLQKPFSLDRLGHKIRKVLDGPSGQRR